MTTFTIVGPDGRPCRILSGISVGAAPAQLQAGEQAVEGLPPEAPSWIDPLSRRWARLPDQPSPDHVWSPVTRAWVIP